MRSIDGRRGLSFLVFCVALTAVLAGCKPKVQPAVARSGLRFCEHQTQTKRGTAPYVVTCGKMPKVDCLKIVAGSGARVVGSVSDRELLIETDVHALAKIYTNDCFAAVRECLPADKVAQGFAAGEATVTALSVADKERMVTFLEEKGVPAMDDLEGGRTVFRAKLTAALVKALAAKGEVRRIAP